MKQSSVARYVVVVLFLLCVCLPKVSAQSYSGGSGTANDPYRISNQQDLEQLFSCLINTNNLSGVHFLLTQDLDLVDFRPFRSAWGIFDGHFDGGGHTVNIISVDTLTYKPLFYAVRGPGVVENVTVSGPEIDFGASIVYQVLQGGIVRNCVNLRPIKAISGGYCGGIAGYVHSSTVTGCVNRGTVRSLHAANAAGIAGICAAGMVSGCTNYASVVGNGGYTAGIVCVTSGIVDSCINYGDIIDPVMRPLGLGEYDYAAGIVAMADGYTSPVNPDSRIVGCYNYGSIIHKSHQAYIGGIVGFLWRSPIKGCANAGNIDSRFTDYAYVGGISGRMHQNFIGSTVRYVVDQCVNTGNLKATMISSGGPSYYGSCVGGICGSYGDSVSNCLNAGRLEGNYVGGILGGGFTCYTDFTMDSLVVFSTLDNCLNVGQTVARGGMAYTLANNGICRSNCFYDRQMCTASVDDFNGRDAARGLTTLQLVDGDTLSNESLWTAYAAMYPWPSALSHSPIAHAAATPVFLRQIPNPNFGGVGLPRVMDSVTRVDSCFSLGSGWRNTSLWASCDHSVEVLGFNFPHIVAAGTDTLSLFIDSTLLKQVVLDIVTPTECACLMNHVDDTVAPVPFIWVDGKPYSHDTHRPTYWQILAEEDVCDTLRHLELHTIVAPPPDSVVVHIYDTVCSGSTILFCSSYVGSNKVYRCLTTAEGGYDSIVYLHLYVSDGPPVSASYAVVDSLHFRIDLDAQPGTVRWSAVPEDPSLVGQEGFRSIVVSPGQTTCYTAQLQYDDERLCPNSTSVTIPIASHRDEDGSKPVLDVPNIFNPGSDENGTLVVNGRNIDTYEIYIYNRQGLLVWHSDNINESWDGTHRGVSCPQGSYAYVAFYTGFGGYVGRHHKVGTVTLIR